MHADADLELPEKRAVAFLDLLGFRDVIERMGEEPGRYRSLVEIFDDVEKMQESIKAMRNRDGLRSNDLQLTFFSDSIVISDTADARENVLLNAGLIAKALLVRGMLCRGGVAIGETHHKGNVVFGSGLLQAYDLEQKARFPRIIVQPAVIDEVFLREGARLRIEKGDDEFDFVDPFAWLRVSGPGLHTLWPDDPVDEEGFVHVKRGLEKGLEKTRSNSCHYKKWRWMAERFNEAVSRMDSSCEQIELSS